MAKMVPFSAESSSLSTFDSNNSLHSAALKVSPTPATHIQHDPHSSTQAQQENTPERRFDTMNARRNTHHPPSRRRAHRTCLLGSILAQCFRLITTVAAYYLSFFRITVNAFPMVQEHIRNRRSRKSNVSRREVEQDDEERSDQENSDEDFPSTGEGSSKDDKPTKDNDNTLASDGDPLGDDDEPEDDEEGDEEPELEEPEDEHDHPDTDEKPPIPEHPPKPGNQKEHRTSRNPKKLPIPSSTHPGQGNLSHTQQTIYTHTEITSTNPFQTSANTSTFTSLQSSPSVATLLTNSPVFQDQSVDSKDNDNNNFNSNDSSNSITARSPHSPAPTESRPVEAIASPSGSGIPTPTQSISDNNSLSLALSTNILPLTMVGAFVTFLVISAALYRRRNRQRVRVATTSKSPTLKGPTPSLDPISPSSHSPSPPPPPGIPLSFPVVITIPSTTQVHLQPTRSAHPPLGGPGPRISLPSSRRLALPVISEEEFDDENEESSEHEVHGNEIVPAVKKKESLRRKRSKGKGHIRKTSQRLDGDELRLVLRK
ncbi:hypothetical protein BJ742DRAFT_90050 [Cladochytrium replicatum]|nr:hypothetical protein BJ742DRAFT_90050 [Cladochytrium replicatum]